MYKIKKTFEVAVSHRLNLPYSSKCQRPHGHNLMITIRVKSNALDPNGMVVDFTHVKEKIFDALDHRNLNEESIHFGDSLNKQPTAENIAKWICDEINELLVVVNPAALCYQVDVQESTGNVASYIDDSIKI